MIQHKEISQRKLPHSECRAKANPVCSHSLKLKHNDSPLSRESESLGGLFRGSAGGLHPLISTPMGYRDVKSSCNYPGISELRL